MDLLTETEAVAMMRVSRSTLTRLKRRGEAPPSTRIGVRKLMYRLDDLVAWMNARTT